MILILYLKYCIRIWKCDVDIIVFIVYFQPLVKFKSHLYYEEKDHVADTVKNLKPTSGSKVCWLCKNK